MDQCMFPGCDLPGMFPATAEVDGETVVGVHCWTHNAGEELDPAPEPEEETFDEAVFAGFAGSILELTGVAMQPDPEMTTTAITSLSATVNLPRDVCAAVIMATTWLAAAGHLTDEVVMFGSEVFIAQANGDPMPVHPDDRDWQDPNPPPSAAETTPAAAGRGSDATSEPDRGDELGDHEPSLAAQELARTYDAGPDDDDLVPDPDHGEPDDLDPETDGLAELDGATPDTAPASAPTTGSDPAHV